MDDRSKKSSLATNKSTSNNTSTSAEEAARVQLTNKHSTYPAATLPDEAFNIDDYDDDEDDDDQYEEDDDDDQFIDDDDDLIEVKDLI